MLITRMEGFQWLLQAKRLARFPVCAVLLLLLTTTLPAQDRNPFAGDAKAAHAGEFQFRINCAFCHGLGARGGGRGPDLTRAHKRHGSSDADLFRTINQGVPGTAMPASLEVKATAQPNGNAAHGKGLFYGDANCSTCHMVAGKGGRFGPDLSAVGSARSIESITESVRNPSRRLAWGLAESTKEFPQEYETATVVTADGREIKGVTMNEDSFSVQLMDTSEKIHLFEKDKLRSFKKSRVSMMPSYDATLLRDKDLQDIVAFLLSVSTK